MKDLMQKVMSFLSFDFALNANVLSQQFAATHYFYQKDIPLWSTRATRQKVIARYWFELVFCHFAILFGLPAILSLAALGQFQIVYLTVVFLAGLIIFLTMLVFHYLPNFYNFFLPQLETVKEIHERKQLGQLEKCKRAQLSNFALVLIYYVFDKLSGANSLQCNDRYATLLTKLYGVDQGSLKKNLELLFGNKKNLSERKLTEIRNQFQEAHDFFENIEFRDGLKTLGQLEQKFRSNR
jgi:fucose 4-O-acetylase-like acetyltransferase